MLSGPGVFQRKATDQKLKQAFLLPYQRPLVRLVGGIAPLSMELSPLRQVPQANVELPVFQDVPQGHLLPEKYGRQACRLVEDWGV